ncbi:MAG: hypothetical protein C0494_16930 [Sphingobium sp.]|nr:hypothetical protein [Sphingobium sp.]
MGFGMGINAVLHAVDEVTYGTTPASGFKKLPFVSTTLGEERPLIEDDQLGFGREGLDPAQDVATNDGDIVVPVDIAAIGFWLKGFFGPAAVTGAGPYTHIFQSGAAALPSRSIEIGNPDVPSFSVHYGAMVNQIRIAMARSGMLNATLSLIAQGESVAGASSVAGTPTAQQGARFAHATGVIKRDGTALANIVSADLSMSNSLEKVEVIRSDGRIGGIVPGVVQVSLRITARFDSLALLTAATDGTPINLDEVGWANGANSLKFALPRVYLPRVKRPISGPGGVMAEFNCQASGAGGHKITAKLINSIASY